MNKYIRGTRGSLHRVDHFKVCEALGFDHQATCEYLACWDITLDDPPSVPAIVKKRDCDIGFFERITKLSQLAMRGNSSALQTGHNPKIILREMAEVSEQLRGLPYTQTDPPIANARINADLFFAALQEATLPWWGNRAAITIRTYDRLEEEVFQKISLEGNEDNYARLCLRRAVLRREGKEKAQAQKCEVEMRKLGPLFARVSSPILRIAYSCQYLHTLAVIEEWDLWSEMFEDIHRNQIGKLRITDALRKRLYDILTYAEGVGFKRFMWSLHDTPDERMRNFALHSAKSLGALTANNGAQAVHDINLYHEDIPVEHVQAELESSTIDALVWCNLDMALERALSLQQQAYEIYPAMLHKLSAQLALIKDLMGAKERSFSLPQGTTKIR